MFIPFFVCTLVPEASTLPSSGQAVEGFIIGEISKASLCPLPSPTRAAAQVHASTYC